MENKVKSALVNIDRVLNNKQLLKKQRDALSSFDRYNELNKGYFEELNYLEEDIFISVYYDSIQIEWKLLDELAPDETRTYEFYWSTDDVPSGEYTIKAEISVVPKETNTSDNIFVYGKVTVPYEGEGDAIILFYVAIVVVVLSVATIIFFKRGQIFKRSN
ncbi:MAG: hypothetical protein L6N96_06860 [Candidatus Methylarchaceae archaeon HK02M2]|nr:hypothetical protein [Candidatus Methylarchaceae archaeon HK02M2]